MNIEEAFRTIVSIESAGFSKGFTYGSINTWPLVRQCLWFELTSVSKYSLRARFSTITGLCLRKVISKLANLKSSLSSAIFDECTESIAFISRPIYLQELSNGSLFDRIIDPLIYCLPDNSNYIKYYLSPCPLGAKLFNKGLSISPSLSSNTSIAKPVRERLENLASHLNINPKRLINRYSNCLNRFNQWYKFGRSLFRLKATLKFIYITSWYFPDAMGLIAAAKEQGIKVIDVQHGKQGSFQAMYSGWVIPEEGYVMMPDIFWCWGKPSAEHILKLDNGRAIHRPILGGYPWIDYYRRHILKIDNRIFDKGMSKSVLVTLQPTQGDNIEPLPDFIIEFLNQKPKDIHFTFRCHPGLRDGADYCSRRLSAISNSLYSIDDGISNLYDLMIKSTHHITAYSSCCYEASAFGVRTLLYGVDAKSIYANEIERDIFDWIYGSSKDLKQWLENKTHPNENTNCQYIVSSLEHTRSILEQAQNGNFNYDIG